MIASKNNLTALKLDFFYYYCAFLINLKLPSKGNYPSIVYTHRPAPTQRFHITEHVNGSEVRIRFVPRVDCINTGCCVSFLKNILTVFCFNWKKTPKVFWVLFARQFFSIAIIFLQCKYKSIITCIYMCWHIIKPLQSKLNVGSDSRNFCVAVWLKAHLKRKNS